MLLPHTKHRRIRSQAPRHYKYDKNGSEGYITDALGYTANRLASVTTARGITTLYTYDEKTGLITAIGFTNPDTTRQQHTYNILGQPTEITDAADTRTLTYDRYGKADLEQFSFLAIGYTPQEQWDAYGRSIGYQLIRNDTQLWPTLIPNLLTP